jgi:signal transduction histidine kinase
VIEKTNTRTRRPAARGRADRRHAPSRLPDLTALAAKLRTFARERRALPLLYIEFSDPRRAKSTAAHAEAYKRATAAALRASIGSILRKNDLVAASAGGEWFIALLTARATRSGTRTSDPDLGLAAERLRRAVQRALSAQRSESMPAPRATTKTGSRPQARVTVRCGWNVLELFEIDHPLEALRHAVRGAALVARIEERRATILAAVTHELRTPLTAIIGFAERLQTARLGASQRRRSLDIIVDESKRLHRLVEGLIDIGSWTTGNLVLRTAPRELEVIARKAAASVADRAAQKQVTIEIAGRALALVDPDRCLQILINLLDNAVRYSPEHGRVDVVITASGRSSVVAVSDQGRGFGALSRMDVGLPFASGADGKVGLGLAISGLLAQAHGGALRVGPGRRGGLVRVTLPNAKRLK